MSGMDFMGVSHPNERKYFDETKGCTLNSQCGECGKKQYQPEGVYTVYHGQCYLHNVRKEIMGIAYFDDKKGKVGLRCLECWLTEFPEELETLAKVSEAAARIRRKQVAAKRANKTRKSRATKS